MRTITSFDRFDRHIAAYVAGEIDVLVLPAALPDNRTADSRFPLDSRVSVRPATQVANSLATEVG